MSVERRARQCHLFYKQVVFLKKFGSKALVADVNIHIPKGEIYGFLGPNGAGKTTVMKMITNLWKPTSGTIEVFGEVLTPKSYEVLKRMGSNHRVSHLL